MRPSNIVPLFKRTASRKSIWVPQQDFGRNLGNKFPNSPLSSTNPSGKLLCSIMIKSMSINFGSRNPLKVFNFGDQLPPSRLTGRRKLMKRSIKSSNSGKLNSLIRRTKCNGDIHPKVCSLPRKHTNFSINPRI